MAVWLSDFPLPPSVNTHLVPVVSGKYAVNKRGQVYQKAHFYKSKEHSNYYKQCQEWAFLNQRSFLPIKKLLLESKKEHSDLKVPFCLQVDHYFAYQKDRIFTVNRLPEQLDADNGLKPCRDALAKLLEIDDKHFFSGFFEKVTCDKKEQECSMIRISHTSPRTLDSVKYMMATQMAGTSSGG